VWVADEFGGKVVRIDPATNAVDRTVSVGNSPQGLAAADGMLWVGAQATAVRHRGGTLRLVVNSPFNVLDPATFGSLQSWLTISMTNDGLTAFKHVGGSDGAQVVPDLAVSLPAPTDGGLSYTFQLRRGIRYSNGAPVRPEDFLRTAERDLRLAGGPFEGFDSVIGGAACTPSRCDLSKGIVVDNAANRITFNLAAPDPEFTKQLAAPGAVAVAPGAPENGYTSRPLPATGPYEVETYAPSRLVRLVRNPYFHQWSRAAQPDGFPDQIVWRIGASTSAALTAVERGRADYTLDGPPPDRMQEVQTRFASQLHTNPNDATIQLRLNTTVAPFNDVRVRRALSFAVDRSKLGRLLGQSSKPTCQLLAPYIPGYEPYCPYTVDPGPGGAGPWRSPDLNRAEGLIAASHTRGMRVVIWSQPVPPTDFTTAGRYLVSLLDKLGYHARVRAFAAQDSTFERVWDPANKVQAAFWVVVPPYPAASYFFRDFQCENYHPLGVANLNPSGFCKPGLEATMFGAVAAEQTGSPAATALWARADRQITDQAPFVSFATPSYNDFVSRRVGNYTYNAAFGVLIDQLWVR
jgi:peptide/nickel transport system substrate-binding protein